MRQSALSTTLLTTAAMLAFASNSLLNRLALGQGTIDAVSYTTIRLTSGAITLFAIAYLQKESGKEFLRGSWISAAFLFLYAIAFSLAYLNLTTGMGALILFGSVQITMLVVALRSGERPHPLEWTGLLLALGGLVYLVFPGLTAPPLLSSILMLIAGFSWGLYSIRGRGTQDPLAGTAGNFIYSVPMILAVLLISFRNVFVTSEGVIYGILSGTLTSGGGYVIWYAALRGLTTTRAATVQLSVPVIAAWSGVVFLAEQISLRLLIAAALILGGIALAVSSRLKKP